MQKSEDFCGGLFSESNVKTYFRQQQRCQSTPPIAEIIWVKNVRAIVVCGFLMKLLKKTYPENLKENSVSRLKVTC